MMSTTEKLIYDIISTNEVVKDADAAENKINTNQNRFLASEINLFHLVEAFECNVKISKKKNESLFLSYFRDVPFSKEHINIRIRLLNKIKNISELLRDGHDNVKLVQQLREAFTTAILESTNVHRSTALERLKKINLVDVAGNKVLNQDTYSANAFGTEIACDQHFILEKANRLMFGPNGNPNLELRYEESPRIRPNVK